MFQRFSSRVPTVGLLRFRRFNSTEIFQSRAKETREVKLIGTIDREPLSLNNGHKVINIRTKNDEDEHENVHRTYIGNTNLLSMIGNNLQVGQRVYIAGQLQGQEFLNDENKKRQSYQINVGELYASKMTNDTSESDESLENIDLNSVLILSHVISEIEHYANFSIINVNYHYVKKNEIEGESLISTLIRVSVFDRILIELVKKNIQRKDRILIDGSLYYKRETDLNGQKKYSGHIKANKILRIDRFTEE